MLRFYWHISRPLHGTSQTRANLNLATPKLNVAIALEFTPRPVDPKWFNDLVIMSRDTLYGLYRVVAKDVALIEAVYSHARSSALCLARLIYGISHRDGLS